MDWKRTGKIAGKLFLLFLEYFFKLSAAVVACIVMSAKGSFTAKLSTGFASLSPALRQLFSVPGQIADTAAVINDYNTLTAAAFNEQYGAQAVSGVLEYLNEGILFFQTVNLNLYYRPLATIAATGLAFSMLYLLARVLRFARQKGRGSFLTRLERKIGKRVFQNRAWKKRRRFKKQQQIPDKKFPDNGSVSHDKPARSSTSKSSTSRSNNYLKKHIKSHQNQ